MNWFKSHVKDIAMEQEINDNVELTADLAQPQVENEQVVDTVSLENGTQTESNNKSVDDDGLPIGAKKRIDKLTRIKYEQDARIRSLEDQYNQVLSMFQQQQAATQPRLEDMTAEQRVEYLAEQKARKAFEDYQQQEQAKHRALNERQVWQQKIAQVKDELPDYDEVVADSTIPMPNDLLQAIMQSDDGPRIAYHLASNPEYAYRLASLPPRDRDREFLKLELKMESQRSAPKAQATKKPQVQTTPTPTPASTVQKSWESMDAMDFIRARNKQLRGR